MFDMHYDLLTFIYMANRQGKSINKLIRQLRNSKIFGITANLYFMSKDEMTKELDYPKDINVLDMFRETKHILEKNKLDFKILYSIEGCSYIKDINELEKLYKEGLNSIILVWNDENKYGSGYYTDKGLTEEGRKFIRKAIDLGLAIDLSHANEKTFDDIIEEIKNKDAICYASHSNIKSLHDHPRNLSTKQLQKLKEVNGYLGIVAYPKFLTDEKGNKKLRNAYIKHIAKAVTIMGIDHVMLSSDNMDYLKKLNVEYNSDKAIYPYSKMTDQIMQDLLTCFNKTEVDKIMFKNARQLFEKIKNK